MIFTDSMVSILSLNVLQNILNLNQLFLFLLSFFIGGQTTLQIDLLVIHVCHYYTRIIICVNWNKLDQDDNKVEDIG